MAMVAKKAIVWQEPGTENRTEIGLESVVPDTVPLEIQKEWLKQDWIFDDPTKEHLAIPEGPPRMSMPLRKIQEVEERKKAIGTPVLGRSVPPRPVAS